MIPHRRSPGYARLQHRSATRVGGKSGGGRRGAAAAASTDARTDSGSPGSLGVAGRRADVDHTNQNPAPHLRRQDGFQLLPKIVRDGWPVPGRRPRSAFRSEPEHKVDPVSSGGVALDQLVADCTPQFPVAVSLDLYRDVEVVVQSRQLPTRTAVSVAPACLPASTPGCRARCSARPPPRECSRAIFNGHAEACWMRPLTWALGISGCGLPWSRCMVGVCRAPTSTWMTRPAPR